jgi:hypothetical protein
VGELATALLAFKDYKVTTGTGRARRTVEHLDEHNVVDLIDGVYTKDLEEAVTSFTSTFAGPAQPRTDPPTGAADGTAAPAPLETRPETRRTHTP